MEETKLLKAYCAKTKRYMGLEIKKIGASWKVVNVIELTDDEATVVVSEERQDSFETNGNLIPCVKCGSRRVGGCSCIKKILQCTRHMKYQFQCVYCDELKIDYSRPSRADLAGRVGETVTLSQGKEIKVVTFSNVEWTKFDNIQYHPVAPREYREPQVHVIASEENIEFHGYNVSQMDEGVYYEIGKNDDFEIDCDVDATAISPHPGGYFYLNFGIITAQIKKAGGTFLINGNKVATVGGTFNMKLSLTEGGRYTIIINGKKRGEEFQRVSGNTRIVFGFAHNSHNCEKLSHAYVKGIKMAQGVSHQ